MSMIISNHRLAKTICEAPSLPSCIKGRRNGSAGGTVAVAAADARVSDAARVVLGSEAGVQQSREGHFHSPLTETTIPYPVYGKGEQEKDKIKTKLRIRENKYVIPVIVALIVVVVLAILHPVLVVVLGVAIVAALVVGGNILFQRIKMGRLNSEFSSKIFAGRFKTKKHPPAHQGLCLPIQFGKLRERLDERRIESKELLEYITSNASNLTNFSNLPNFSNLLSDCYENRCEFNGLTGRLRRREFEGNPVRLQEVSARIHLLEKEFIEIKNLIKQILIKNSKFDKNNVNQVGELVEDYIRLADRGSNLEAINDLQSESLERDYIGSGDNSNLEDRYSALEQLWYRPEAVESPSPSQE